MVNTGLLKEYKEEPCWLELPEVPLYIHKLRVYIQNSKLLLLCTPSTNSIVVLFDSSLV